MVPPLLSTSQLAISRLYPLAYLFAPLNAAFRLRNMPWELDEERSYHHSYFGGFPPLQVTLLDAVAALCTLLDCNSVCVSLLDATDQLLVSLPHPAAALLQEAIEKCLAELQPLAVPGHSPRLQQALEDKFTETAYGRCYGAHRDVVFNEGEKALSLVDTAINEAGISQECEEEHDRGDAGVACGHDSGIDDSEEYEPKKRAIKPSDMPRLQGLRHALSGLLSAMRTGEDYLTVYARGISVLTRAEDKALAPVLRGIDWSLRLTVIRKVCALPWTVHTFMHVARNWTSVEPQATFPKSVTWIHPPPSYPPPPPLSLPTTEDLVIALQAVSPEMSRDDCVAVIKEGFECLEACRRWKDSTAGDIHAEAVLIHHIVSNKFDVYPYLATSPIAFSWSCYACARLLSVVNAERQLRLALRGCSDEMILPSSLPPFDEDIEAALLAQLQDDVRALAMGHLQAVKYKRPVRAPISFERFKDSDDSSQNSQD